MLKSVFFSSFFFLGLISYSQDSSVNTLPTAFSKGWHAKVQFAGSIGFLSIAAGRSGKNLEADLWYGYVPKSLGGATIHTATAKITWFPVKPVRFKSIAARPLSLGSFISYTYGSQYFLFNPEQYPFSYYGYPTALHVGLFAGGQVALQPNQMKHLDKWSLYYEVGTTDFRLASYFTNTAALSITDVFTLGIGIKRKF